MKNILLALGLAALVGLPEASAQIVSFSQSVSRGPSRSVATTSPCAAQPFYFSRCAPVMFARPVIFVRPSVPCYRPAVAVNFCQPRVIFNPCVRSASAPNAAAFRTVPASVPNPVFATQDAGVWRRR